MQVMPVIVGLTLAEARARLSLLTIVATFPEDRPDTARVLTQQPPPGTLLGPTTTVSMTVSAT
jgi:beta-lactam-binding protein with PASTA domain